MNKFISDAFANIIDFLHILFVLLIIFILYIGNDIFNGDLKYPIIFSIIISIIYILSIGLIVTVININNTLTKIEKKIGSNSNNKEITNNISIEKNSGKPIGILKKEKSILKTKKNRDYKKYTLEEYFKIVDDEVVKTAKRSLVREDGEQLYVFGEQDNFIHYNVINHLSGEVEILKFYSINKTDKTNKEFSFKSFNDWKSFENFVSESTFEPV